MIIYSVYIYYIYYITYNIIYVLSIHNVHICLKVMTTISLVNVHHHTVTNFFSYDENF